jgi:Electron transfer DM13
MKIVICFLIVGSFLACSKKQSADNPAQNDVVINATAVLKYQGNLVATSGIVVNGNVKIYQQNNTYIAQLNPFNITSGPDLKVYLSKAATPSEFINLGALKSNTGEQNYAIPANVDFAQYKYVLIHCQQYNHSFAVASINP